MREKNLSRARRGNLLFLPLSFVPRFYAVILSAAKDLAVLLFRPTLAYPRRNRPHFRTIRNRPAPLFSTIYNHF